MSRLVKGVGALVGLATEAAAHRKRTASGESQPEYSHDRSAPSSSQDALPTYDQVEQQDEEIGPSMVPPAYAGQHGEDSRLAFAGARRGWRTSRAGGRNPNHPANSGSLVALLTGGVVDPEGVKRSAGRRERRRGQRQESGKEGLLVSVKKVITQDVLYLMIAEMPSPEEQERLLRGGRL